LNPPASKVLLLEKNDQAAVRSLTGDSHGIERPRPSNWGLSPSSC
jgi:hypothetical protein